MWLEKQLRESMELYQWQGNVPVRSVLVPAGTWVKYRKHVTSKGVWYQLYASVNGCTYQATVGGSK
jgi:hypothetical protein